MAECPICYAEFLGEGDLVPLILECGHSICQGCIDGILRNNRDGRRSQGQGKCPICNHRCMKDQISNFSKNFSLLDEIEKRKHITNEQESCRCLKNPSFYCKRCKKYLCNVCTQNHVGHPIVIFEAESIATRARAERMIEHLTQSSDKIEKNIDSIEKARLEAIENSKLCKKKLTNFVHNAKKTIDRVAEIIEQDIQNGLSNSLRQIESAKEKLTVCLDTISFHRDNLIEASKPFIHDETIMNRNDRLTLDGLVEKSEEDVPQVLAILPNQIDLEVVTFKIDGPDITHNRIYNAMADSCKVASKPIKFSLLSNKHNIDGSGRLRKNTA